MSKKVLAFCKKHFVGAVKTGFSVSIATFWKKNPFEKSILFETSLNIEQKQFSLFRKIFGGAAKTTFYVSIRIIRRKILYWKKRKKIITFSETEWKISCLQPKAFRWGCQNWILRVHRSFLKKKISFWNVWTFQNLFEHRAKKFSLFQDNFGGAAKTVFYVYIGTFRRKTLFWKKRWKYL